MSSKNSSRDLILEKSEQLVLEHGFAGLSIDQILEAVNLSKGAFFYHFKSKQDLAKALVERFAARDLQMFEDLKTRAAQLSEDPLQQILISLKLFQEKIECLDCPPAGCLFAAYLHEAQQFDECIHEFIANEFGRWQHMYTEVLERVFQAYRSEIATEPRVLAQTIVTLIEGGLILSKSYKEPHLLAEQIAQLRQFLQLNFRKKKT